MKKIEWLINLHPQKGILALLLIAVSVLWAGSLVDKRDLKETLITMTNDVISTKQEVVDCQLSKSVLLKELLYNVINIENKTKEVDSTTKAIQSAAIIDSKKIKKFFNNAKK